MRNFRTQSFSAMLFAAVSVMAGPAVSAPADGFNKYILKAVAELYAKYPSKGYDINKAYSHDINYGTETVKASQPPLTMCVAATAEVMITALNIYAAETKDTSVYNYFPASSWNRMRPKDIRAHIWVDPKLDSYGTADALVTFAVGKRVRFNELTPGSFVNINRLTKTGHSVVFISFIDGQANELSTYSDKVAGFKYFSAQGKGTTGDAGFAYRYAFFAKQPADPYCPTLPAGKHRDCKIIWSTGQKLLNTGYMLMPSKWDAAKRDKNLKDLADGLYVQTRSRGPSALPGINPDLSEDDFMKAINETDTMELNPVFTLGNMTTDD
jgi:hypothetical protein